MTEIICAAIAGLSSVIVAVVSLNIKKSNKKAEQRAALREERDLLNLHMMDATLQLSIVTSNALTGGHNNGNVERAREAAKKASDEYEEFMREVTVHEVCR